MVYSEKLVERITNIVEGQAGLTQSKMFGGVGFLIHGNMACGVNKDDLIIRVGLEQYENALLQHNTKVFDLTGRPMKGWIVVTSEGYATDGQLKAWVGRGIDYANSLPPK